MDVPDLSEKERITIQRAIEKEIKIYCSNDNLAPLPFVYSLLASCNHNAKAAHRKRVKDWQKRKARVIQSIGILLVLECIAC